MPDGQPQPPFEQVKWAQEQQIEERKWLHELKREDAKRAHDANRDFHTYVNKGIVDTANLTLRTLVLINGGAAIAVLTFLSGLAGKERLDYSQIGIVTGSIKWFAFGVALAVSGIALSYLTNFALTGISSSQEKSWEHPYLLDTATTGKWRLANRTFHVLAVAAALLSLLMFMVGMFTTSNSIPTLFKRDGSTQAPASPLVLPQKL